MPSRDQIDARDAGLEEAARECEALAAKAGGLADFVLKQAARVIRARKCRPQEPFPGEETR